MANSIIGFHYSVGGNKNGVGAFMKKLNEAGIPFLMKGTDDAGLCFEGQALGKTSGVNNWLIYRVSTAGQPHGVEYDVPDYTKSPQEAAKTHWDKTVAKWPQELDKSVVWMEPINEPRAKLAPGDVQWQNMHPTDWLGAFMVEYAQIANANGYKVCGPSFNAGEPEVAASNEYELPGMLAYLGYCAANPDKAALSVHEYTWARWADGENWSHWYPALWGRVEAALAAADKHGIPRTFAILITEWGFAHDSAPTWPACEPYLTAYNQWAARWPQVKGAAAWTLQAGWGDISNDVQSWLAPLADYAVTRQFDAGAQPARTQASFGGTLPGVVMPPAAANKRPADTPKTIATKVVIADIGLNLRAGPSREHAVLKALPKGTAVEVLEEGAWDLVRVGETVGYASSDFLAAGKPNGAVVPADVSGDFRFVVWPTTDKQVTQKFGEQPDVYKKLTNGFLPAHEGIDLVAPLGTPYYCVAPGRVSKVSDKRDDGTASAYGWHVVVEHANGYSTLYAHATPEILVHEGDQVAAGQILAHSGNTGHSSGPHLHLTLKKAGHRLPGWPAGYLDPWPFLEPLHNQLRPPMGDLGEGYLFATSLDIRDGGIALTRLNLNLRERPNDKSRILAVVPKGRTVRLLREVAENGYYYCEVSNNGEAQPKEGSQKPKRAVIDLLPYIKGDGRQYEVKNASGSQERFQTQVDGLTFYQVKNAQWEQFFYDDDFIYRDIDTSPGGGRYYRMKDADRQRGSRWLRRRMAVGDSYTQARQVQFYLKENGSLSAANSGNVTDTMKLVAHHPTYKLPTGLELEDVLELQWVNGGESYFYARCFGLVGWARQHDDPNSPAWSAVAEIHQPGAREPFAREQVRVP